MSENNKRYLLFLKKCPLGTKVDILTNGNSIHGVFTESDDETYSITVSDSECDNQIFFDDSTTWKIFHTPTEEVSAAEPETQPEEVSQPEPEAKIPEEVPPVAPTDVSTGNSDETAPVMLTAPEEIQESQPVEVLPENSPPESASAPESTIEPSDAFREAITAFEECAGNAKICTGEYTPAFPKEKLADIPSMKLAEIRKEWGRSDNIYKNAIRIKELSRLHECVEIFADLDAKYPKIAEFAYMAGYMAEASSEPCKSLPWFSSAAELGIPFAYLKAAEAASKAGKKVESLYYLLESCGVCAEMQEENHLLVLMSLLVDFNALDEAENVLAALVNAQAGPAAIRYWVQLAACGFYEKGYTGEAQSLFELSQDKLDARDSYLSEYRKITSAVNLPPASPQWAGFIRERRKGVEEKKAREAEAVALLRRKEARDNTPIHNGVIYAIKKGPRGYFGFLRDMNAHERYFKSNNVISETLSKEIFTSVSPYQTLDVKVFFTPQSVVHNGIPQPQADKIHEPYLLIDLLNEAISLADAGQHSQAIDLARKILAVVKKDEEIERLIQEWREANRQAPDTYIALPQGNSFYARAKRAQLDDKDFQNAEKLYMQSIEQEEPQKISAIKDLVMLLDQMEQHQRAVDIIEKYRGEVPDTAWIYLSLATSFFKMGKYEDSISANTVLKKYCLPKRKPHVDRMIAMCYIRLENFKAAEESFGKFVQAFPANELARKTLERIQEAKITGVFNQLGESFGSSEFTDTSSGISPFLKYFLERCEYEGLDRKTISQGFTGQTIEKLEALASEQGVDRPREKANTYRTIAKIHQEMNAEKRNDTVFFMRQFCAMMGDNAILEGRHYDVVRDFYIEFFQGSAGKWTSQHEIMATQFLLSWVLSHQDLSKIKDVKIENVISRLFLFEQPLGFWNYLLELFLVNSKVVARLTEVFFKNRNARDASARFFREHGILQESGKIENQEQFVSLWDKLRNKRLAEHDRLNDIFTTLQKLPMTQEADLEHYSSTLQGCNKIWLSETDRAKVRKLSEFSEHFEQLQKADSFPDKERALQMIEASCDRLLKDIDDTPTRFSIRCCYPLLFSIKTKIDNMKNRLYAESVPKIMVEVPTSHACPDEGGIIRVNVSIENAVDSSPVSDVKLLLTPCSSQFTLFAPMPSINTITGGDKKIVQAEIQLSPEALNEKVFLFDLELHYRDRQDNFLTYPKKPFSVQLQETFNRITPNPYAGWGGRVESKEMFFGREEILDEIFHALEGPTGKCFVLYGQKRCGKSSVLFHLKNKLIESQQFIPASFEMAPIAGEASAETSLLYMILREIQNALMDIMPNPQELVFDVPPLTDLNQLPRVIFIQKIKEFLRTKNELPAWKDRKIVLLIDEFTYMYGEIECGRIPETFMKLWKSLIGEQLFSAVLVGQDSMPRMMNRFANEFAALQKERLSYLDEASTRDLIEKPIMIEPGKSRFIGDSIRQIIELTAGNPYYVQIFGERLVHYINRVRVEYISEVEVDRVKEQLISGVESLEATMFESLTSPGDSVTNPIASDDAEKVLCAIAKESQGVGNKCPGSRIVVPGMDRAKVLEIIDDLVVREVIDRTHEETDDFFRIRVGLYKAWLLANR